MKRMLTILVSVMMILGLVFVSASASSAPTVMVQTASEAVKPGDTVTLDVAIANNTGFTNFEWVIDYDESRLELKSINTSQTVSVPGVGNVNVPYITDGTYVSNVATNFITCITANPFSVDVALFTLTFEVKATAAAGKAEVKITSDKFENGATDPITTIDATYVAGGVTVAAVHTCDNGEPVEGTAATCTADGWNGYYKCSCNKLYADADCQNEITDLNAWKTGAGKIEAGHTYGELIEAKPAVHTQTELEGAVAAHYFCDVCDTFFTEGKVATTLEGLTGEDPSHSYGEWVNTDAAKHWKECNCGLKAEEGEHTYDGDTDTTCDCGYIRTIEGGEDTGGSTTGGSTTGGSTTGGSTTGGSTTGGSTTGGSTTGGSTTGGSTTGGSTTGGSTTGGSTTGGSTTGGSTTGGSTTGGSTTGGSATGGSTTGGSTTGGSTTGGSTTGGSTTGSSTTGGSTTGGSTTGGSTTGGSTTGGSTTGGSTTGGSTTGGSTTGGSTTGGSTTGGSTTGGSTTGGSTTGGSTTGGSTTGGSTTGGSTTGGSTTGGSTTGGSTTGGSTTGGSTTGGSTTGDSTTGGSTTGGSTTGGSTTGGSTTGGSTTGGSTTGGSTTGGSTTGGSTTEYAVTVINGTATPGGAQAAGTSVTITADAAPAGQMFDKWVVTGVTVDDENSATTTFTMPAGDVTATATYKNIPVTTYAVTVTNGTATPSGAQATGTSVTITANAAPAGKQFKEWTGADGLTFTSGSKTTATATFTMPGAAVSVTATYADIPVTTYTVTFNANGGSVTPASAETNAEGKLTSLPTPTRGGSYTFRGWYTAASGGNKVTTATVFGANTTIYAQWNYTGGSGGGVVGGGGGGGTRPTTVFSITIADSDNGTITAGSTRASYNSTVTLTVTPNTGYELDTLRVTYGSKEAPLTQKDGKFSFTMPRANVTVTATFKKAMGISNCIKDSSCPMYSYRDLDLSMWYHEGIHYSIANGLMTGIGNGQFAPDASMERAMVIQVLYNMEGKPAVSYTGKFSDVAEGKWYTNAIEWGVANKLISGYGDVFKPEGRITREEIATILYNYAKFKGLDTSARGDLNAFSDGNAVSAWAKEFMQWAVGSGLMVGGGGVLNPTGNATRAEVAQMFKNFNDIFG